MTTPAPLVLDVENRVEKDSQGRENLSSTAAHTPGPWAVDGAGRHAIVRGADLTIVAVRHRLEGRTHEANARLIAAAPDMLALLREIVADPLCQKGAPAGVGHLERAAALVAKAESRS